MAEGVEGSLTAAASAPRPGAGAWSAFALLRHRNYRLLWSGMLVSQTGSWMQFVALGYLVDRLTHAPIYLGLLGVSQALPRLLFAFIGGVVADRLDRRRILLATNLTMMASATLLAVLAAADRIQVWHVLLIGAFNSFIQSFDVPSRQSLVPTLVAEGELMRAVSLLTMAFNGSGIFGPSLGGVVIAAVGEAGCFSVNALSYVAAVVALLRMEVPPRDRGSRESIGEDIREGLGLLARNRHLLVVLGLVAVISFFGRPYIRLMPAYAREVLHVGPRGLGVLQAAPSVGTILAVLVVGAVAGTARKGQLLLGAAFATGALVALFGASRWFTLSAALLVLAGTSQAVAQAAANTLLQTSVGADQRGRMMGLYSMVTFGMFALGTLPLGALAGWIGVGAALTLGGAVVALVVGLLATFGRGIARL
ncbi:MAG: MFS transporter [Armatimonadota bacterium]|nr:MFS transporter [Armatimonadota bacterium]MDR7543372.1 MFS transporter [Armatimonadota bacterium]